MSLEENQEVKPTSRSHLAALVKRGRDAAIAADTQPKDKPSPSAELLLGKKEKKGRAARRPSKSVEDKMIQANRAGSNYDPTDVSDSYDPTAKFTDRVMESVNKKYRYGATDRDLSPGEESNAQAKLAPTRANIAGIKIGAGKERMAGYVKDYRSKLGATTRSSSR